MSDGERFYQKLWFRVYLFPFLASFLFYDKWLNGLKVVFTFSFNLAMYFVFFILYRGNGLPPFTEIWKPLFDSTVLFIIIWSIIYITIYRFSLFMMAQFLLPVNKWEDRKKAFNRLHLFARGKHGAAIFVRNGKLIAKESEIDSKKPGVVLVDLSSAIVLAQQDNAKSWYLPDEDELTPVVKKNPGIKFPWQKKQSTPSFYEAKGPGVVFIEKGQKIDTVFNLRKQTRTSGEVVVYTRNGIKVKSKVTVVFSLSDEPEILTVGYVDGTTPKHLKILKIKQSESDSIIEDTYDLDQDDAEEILKSLNDSTKTPNTPGTVIGGPYKFYKDRVLRAALSQARNKDGDAIVWHETPLEVATDIFRTVLAEIPYDNLFSDTSVYNLYNLNIGNQESKTDDKKDGKPEAQVLSKVKDDFLIRVKLRGMVAIQMIEHLGMSPFYLGQKIQSDFIKKHPPITLVGEKYNFFRNRGIVVKNATFSEVLAVDEMIQKKMIAKWKAKIENEIAVSNAEYELEAIRVHNRNRALLQEEMTHLLSGVFQSTPHFDEALALRVLQALETSVAEMSDEDMQSIDLYEILQNLHDWILLDAPQEDLLTMESVEEAEQSQLVSGSTSSSGQAQTRKRSRTDKRRGQHDA
jgi:hypothetical protein